MTVASVAVLAGVAVGGVAAAKAAEAAATANSRLDEVLKNTAGSSDKVVESVQRQAESLSLLTGVHDEEIKAGQALLGTFKSVAASAGETGGVFDRATVAAVDLAAAGFGSIESNSAGLGKALEDPTKGLALLTKQGTLTADQAKRIGDEFKRTGDKVAAQESILKAMEDQVGGVGEATADSSDKMAVSWQNTKEALGEALLPVLDSLSEKMEGISGFVRENTGAVTAFIAVLAGFAGAVVAINIALKIWRAAVILATAVQWLWNIALNANPIGLIVLAVAAVIAIIAALIAAVVYAYNNFDWFKTAVDAIWNAIKTVFEVVWNAIKAVIGVVIDWIKTYVVTYFKVVKAVISGVWNAIKAVTKVVWDAIQSAIEVVVNWFKGTLLPAFRKVNSVISGIWDAIKAATKAVWDAIVGIVRGVIDKIKQFIEGLKIIIGRVKEIFGNVKDAIVDKFKAAVDFVKGIPGKILDALGNAGEMLFEAGKNIVQGLIDGIKAMIGAAGDAIGAVVDKVKGFLPNSPAKEGPLSGRGQTLYSGQMIVEDVAKGIEASAPKVQAAMSRAMAGVRDVTLDATVSGGNTFNIHGNPDVPTERTILDALARQDALLGAVA